MASGLTSTQDLTFSTLTSCDVERLRAVAHDVTAPRIRIDIRRLGRVIGGAALLAGVFIGGSATFVHLALALPLVELTGKPAVVTAAVAIAVGLLMLGLSARPARFLHPTPR